MRTEFPELLRSLRLAKSLSQRELARRVGVHYSYVSKIESGEERPSQDKVRAIAKALETDPVRLELAAGYFPPEFARMVSEKPEIRRLLELAVQGRLSEGVYQELRELLAREDRVTVPVWLDQG
jgi:transcriptional regulator with XRE-family HTH domain